MPQHAREEEAAVHGVAEKTQITKEERDISVPLVPSKDAEFRFLKEESQKFSFPQKFGFHKQSEGIGLEMNFSSSSPAATRVSIYNREQILFSGIFQLIA